MRRLRLGGLGIAVLALLAACSSAATPAPSAAGSGPGAGSTVDACTLITTAEIQGVLKSGAVTAQSIPGDVSICNYEVAGQPTVTTSFARSRPELVFPTTAEQKADSDVTVSGVGDAAAYLPKLDELYIQKGTAILAIGINDASATLDQRIQLMKQVGVLAIPRI